MSEWPVARPQLGARPPCTGPACDRAGRLRDPRPGATGKLCQAHYQQARLDPERPLRPLRAKRKDGHTMEHCARCGKRRKHYANGLCKSCYEWAQRQKRKQQADSDNAEPAGHR